MRDFHQFLESKQKSSESSKIKAIVELADAICRVFQKLTRHRRKAAWKAITSENGKKEMDRLITNPKLTLNRLRKLSEKDK